MSLINYLQEQKQAEDNALFEGVEQTFEELDTVIEEGIDLYSLEQETLEEAEYQGKEVELDKPFRNGDGPKKFSVYVKNDKGNVVKVNFGSEDMEIKRDDDDRRKSFRARHNCDDPGPKWKARYWSCKMWQKGTSVSDMLDK